MDMEFPFDETDIRSEIIVKASTEYIINMGENIFKEELNSILPNYDSAFMITDSNLELHHEALLTDLSAFANVSGKFVLRPGEKEKNCQNLELILTKMLQSGLTRNSLVIAIGGGVVCDIAGLAASLFKRGIDCHMVPTTLLAMVDASIGGKTGINHSLGKNLIGTIRQPCSITIDIEFLKSLPKRELFAGLAEVIKYGYIFDRDFITYIDQNWDHILSLHTRVLEMVLWYCCEAKSRIVAEDEFEGNIRMLLNFGHTFGHALETYFGYDRLLHGEAVNIGMILANTLSESIGLTEKGFFDSWQELHYRLGIDRELVDEWDVEKLTELMEFDKKKEKENLKLILYEKDSLKIINHIAKKEIKSVWSKVKTKLSS